ncbi:MAG: hypothetical protein H0V84_07455 [Actinobacteria bacterium]|nr:hypothetical protein [Actinomycetota bacterium]
MWSHGPTRFAFEAAFLITVAVVTGLAHLSPPAIIVIMLFAWLLTVLVESATARGWQNPLARPLPPPVARHDAPHPSGRIAAAPAASRAASEKIAPEWLESAEALGITISGFEPPPAAAPIVPPAAAEAQDEPELRPEAAPEPEPEPLPPPEPGAAPPSAPAPADPEPVAEPEPAWPPAARVRLPLRFRSQARRRVEAPPAERPEPVVLESPLAPPEAPDPPDHLSARPLRVRMPLR